MFGLLRIRWLFTLLPRTVRYLGDKRVPFIYKFLPFLFIPFFFTPVARLLTLVPVLGLIDEFTIALIGMALFTWLAEKALKRYATKHPHKTTEAPLQIIEGEYLVVAESFKPIKKKAAEPANAHEIESR
jgi:hypothetical protein